MSHVSETCSSGLVQLSVQGPPKSPYEGGLFVCNLDLREGYPFKKPTCK
jgi:ubiquitin-protein ligase